MRQRNAFIVFTLLYLFLNAAMIYWIGTQWFRTDYGKVGAVFFGVGCWLLVASKPHYQWKSSITKSLLGISLGLLAVSTGLIPISYNIIRSVCFVIGFIIGASSFIVLDRKNIFFLSSWLLACLPVVPLLGSTVGLVNREIYTTLLQAFFPEAKRLGTSLYDGEYAFHIDAGCSGVQGMYLLWGSWNLLVLFTRKIAVNFRSVIEGIGLFWGLNGVRVATLYFLHNQMYTASLSSVDMVLGMVSFVLALVFTISRLKLPDKMPL
jgi:exosortase/archaeosortase family protein